MFFSLIEETPKCLVYKPIKFEPELVEAIDEMRAMFHPPKSFGEWVKGACRAHLEQVYGHRLGFHNVRILSKKFEDKLGNTFRCEVIPDSLTR